MTAYPGGPGTRAFAHRGWHIGDLAGCENSLAAFTRAVAEGFRYLETDVHATADGVLVAFHDHFLDQATDGRGRISKLSWNQVRTARIGGREPIPLLAEMLEALPDTYVNIDPKTDAAVGPLIDLLRTSGSSNRVGLGSFSDARLATLRTAVGPDIATSMGPREVGRLLIAAKLGLRPANSSAAAAQVPVQFGRTTVVSPRFLTKAHGIGIEVHVWTIDDAAEMHRLLDLGVDGIMTDRPDRLRQVLIDRGQWPS